MGGDYGEKLSRRDITLGPIKFPREVVSYAGLVQRGSESTKLQAGVIGNLRSINSTWFTTTRESKFGSIRRPMFLVARLIARVFD